MPSDNLENLFRNKTEEVQHTPPPQFNWTPDKSWDKLQPMLATKPKPYKTWFYRGVAAGLIIALMAGLALYQMPKAPSAAITTVAASAGKKPVATSAEIAPEKPSGSPQPAPALAASAAPSAPTAAPSARENARTRKIALPLPSGPEKETAPAQAVPQKEPEPTLLAVSDSPAADSQPIKITVVLGAKTLARSQAMALAAQPEPEPSAPKKNRRKDKLRLRIHHPDAGLQADTQLATTNPAQSHIGLGTRIKF